ncbi:tRNA glutamyl-Q(34) synthetase GluQRS [Rhodoferax sp. AJA081-3]|uniref:tRNA glutamyl-Q(34) synthetase GluQRS n=1 Tax=Rhodoferax sp. AJA081-3 TaxID=2752316 RepID=UPI001ADF9A91|nr:tRNA glutamyl-Q(34) synthetase GluQRS [Rhodoferax sp. AJA081-3]QTN29347.1 tRNA glutamyl-Q(34) synthetase GluQRS [Rhodoferax sp. AJA081-3]
MSPTAIYRGRFAPSPTGPLHAGSLVAALASWLDARAHGGQWLVRIEDVDVPRTVAGATERILQQLSDCGLTSDEPVVRQSTRSALYQEALYQLITAQRAYPCCCSRKDIAAAIQAQGRTRARHGELVYPGTCRLGMRPSTCADAAPNTVPPSTAWRFLTESLKQNWPLAPVEYEPTAINSVALHTTHWQDRWMGAQQQDVAAEVGDFVLKRADGCATYQLAVVVDDGAQGITHVVRGLDLADNTARQVMLQQALGLPTPQYLHTPLVLGVNGEKLSKQNGAQALDTSSPAAALAALQHAAQVLGLPASTQTTIPQALSDWTAAWHQTYLATAMRMDRAT